MIINIWPIPLLDKDLLDIKPFLRKFRYRGFCSLYPIAALRLDRPGIYPHPLAFLQELSRSCARAPSAEPGPQAVFGPTAISFARARSRLSALNPPYFMPMTVPPILQPRASPPSRSPPCAHSLVGGGPRAIWHRKLVVKIPTHTVAAS